VACNGINEKQEVMTEWDLPSICCVGVYWSYGLHTLTKSPLETTMTSTISATTRFRVPRVADQTLKISTIDAIDAVVHQLSCTDY